MHMKTLTLPISDPAIAAAVEQQQQQQLHPENPEKPQRSPAQIAASLSNGRKSLGPTTPEGLAKCTLAGNRKPSHFQHSQFAETVLIAGESRRSFIALLERYIEDYQPATEAEHNVVQKMAVAYWLHIRSWSMHQTAINCEIARQDPTLHPAIKATEADRTLASYGQIALRNQSTYDRLFRGALRDLSSLRKLRGTTSSLDLIPTPTTGGHWENNDDTANLSANDRVPSDTPKSSFHGENNEPEASIIPREIPKHPEKKTVPPLPRAHAIGNQILQPRRCKAHSASLRGFQGAFVS
jgi:hypothetical protein